MLDLVDENEKLRAENFALAAGQCANVVSDEGGTPQCAEIAKLRAALKALIDECNRDNALAVEYLGCSLISASAIDAALTALTGERVVSFCAGYPHIFEQPAEKAPVLDWSDPTAPE